MLYVADAAGDLMLLDVTEDPALVVAQHFSELLDEEPLPQVFVLLALFLDVALALLFSLQILVVH